MFGSEISGLTGITIGISLAVIVLSLSLILSRITIGRPAEIEKAAKRLQDVEGKINAMGERIRVDGEETQKRIEADGKATIERIRAHGEATQRRIQASGEETRRQIAETHKRVTGRDL